MHNKVKIVALVITTVLTLVIVGLFVYSRNAPPQNSSTPQSVPPVDLSLFNEYSFTDVEPGTQKINGISFFRSLTNFSTTLCAPLNSEPENKVLECTVTQVSENYGLGLRAISVADDSLAAERNVYKLEQTDQGWTIVGVESKHKCRPGRGSTDWFNGQCV